MMVQKFDRSVLKVGQVLIMATNILAFALGYVLQVRGAWVLAPIVGLVMLLGVVDPRWGLFRQLYQRVLKPRGLVKPRVVEEDPTPHQFAQVVGSVFLLGSGMAFLLGGVVLGWVLAWIVIALAFVNFAFDFCAGCQVYFQLERLKLVARKD
ncbi:MAG: DUF4395 domain-containing protein [Candidatus Dormibacteria bacterium]